ncbi:MAG: 3-keto-5-aminohexanoate cleavage protein, partial [Actinobacteria bacterium]|nr:3-keto-5-aminohexanoate cleavage protein [Actinomycetota bacterium]
LATVNICEDGAELIMRALLDAGVAIEAGVWSVEDAERVATSRFAPRITRVLVEPHQVDVGDALQVVSDIHAVLDRHDVDAPRLQHGDGEATWILIEDAVRRGIDTRVGLEDTLHGPDGEVTTGNEALVRAARALGAGAT